jgi:hypothetical protein
MMWKSLTTLVPEFQTNPLAAEVVLTEAYNAVFRGSPSKDQQMIVLADMLAKSGFAQVSPEDISPTALMYREGKREVFSNVFAYLSLSPSDRDALHNAARREAAYANN